jgi:TetR/AcrR family transcriptional regulator
MAKRSRTKPSVRRRSRETRAAILRAAGRIFAERGPLGARTEAIAAAAGVNKAMLYYYFRSKEGLYRAVLEEHMRDFHRQAMEVLSSEGPVGATLLRYVSMHFDFISARPFYPRLFQALVMAGGRTLEQIGREHFLPLARKFMRLIDRGVRRGELNALDSMHTAISLVALTVFYFTAAPVVRVVSGVEPCDPAGLARRKKEVLKFVRYALFRHPEAAGR